MNDLVHENTPALVFATPSLVALGSLQIRLPIALNHRHTERCVSLLTPRPRFPINGTASASLSCRGLLMEPQGMSENVRSYTDLNFTVYFLQLSVIAPKLLYHAFCSLDYDRA